MNAWTQPAKQVETTSAMPAAAMPAASKPASSKQPVILALARDQERHLEPFRNRLSLPVVIDERWRPDVFDHYDAALVLVLSNDVWDSDVCLREARRRGIPSLFLMDGILEFKHQWSDPKFAAGGGAPFLTPVLADKIACKGWNDARRLEAWGNQGKCEIVGLPRLDPLLPPKRRPRERGGRPRILVASANTPWFDENQRESALAAFHDLASFAATGGGVELLWRLRRSVSRQADLAGENVDDQPLGKLLGQVDAVITQPSTLQIEAMLSGLPVAVLDYENTPAYLPSAWRISAQSQIEPVIASLMEAEPARMSYQDECLHNELSCESPATTRMVWLIETMIARGSRARRAGETLKLPRRILPNWAPAPPSPHLDLERQYPNHPTFGDRDLLDMRRRLAMLDRELAEARRQLDQRSPGYWFRKAVLRTARLFASRGRSRAPAAGAARGGMRARSEVTAPPYAGGLGPSP